MWDCGAQGGTFYRKIPHFLLGGTAKSHITKNHIISTYHNINIMAGATYKSQFFVFMTFLDGTTYSPSNNITFSQDCLLEIMDLDVANFLTFKAYGPNLFPKEGPDEFPIAITRSSMLAFYKKAISSYMPRQCQQWDEITGRGNPTKSAAAQQVIKDLKKRR